MGKEYFLVLDVQVPYPGLVVELERFEFGIQGRRKLIFTPYTTVEQIKYGLEKEEQRINLRINRLVRNEISNPIDIKDYEIIYNPTDGWQVCTTMASLLRKEMVIRRTLTDQTLPDLIQVLTERIGYEVRRREFEIDFSLALIQACLYRRLDLAIFFIQQGADVNRFKAVDDCLTTALKASLTPSPKESRSTETDFCSSTELVELLLDHGAIVTEEFVEMAVEKDLPLSILSRIVRQKMLPSLPHIAADTAVSTGNFTTLNWLLESGLEPLTLDRYDSSPIVKAIYAGKYGIATSLLSAGFQLLDHEEGLEQLLD
jgi:hypothetical protein